MRIAGNGYALLLARPKTLFSGYMGTQAWRLSNGSMTYRALFSCWDASATEQTGWVPGAPGYCERFGGEGTGSHCIVPVELRQGVRYAVRVEFAGAVTVRGSL